MKYKSLRTDKCKGLYDTIFIIRITPAKLRFTPQKSEKMEKKWG